MITEFNIEIALGFALILLVFSGRLGLSLSKA